MGNSNKPSQPPAALSADTRASRVRQAAAPRQFDAHGQPESCRRRGATGHRSLAGRHAQVTLAQAQQMALQITTFFESSKSMNFQALAGDFDARARRSA